jgi:peptidyl-tRNA hydrolase, PTH1 family
MPFIIVGLGNPGEEYTNTRHNAGRIALEVFRKKNDLPEFEPIKKLNSLISEGKAGKERVTLLLPETFMNKSGNAVRPLITSAKKAEKELIVIHDDLDLPLGRVKISFNKSSGGHRGVESIIKNIKTEAFTRVRVGISPANAKGVVKKPKGEDLVNDFIIAPFKPKELDEIKKAAKVVAEALELIIKEGREVAMGSTNSRA